MNHNATILTEEEELLVNQCAARLRVIQADAYAASADKRREYLSEAVHQTFKGRTPGDRQRLITALWEQFPVAGSLVDEQPETSTGNTEADNVPERLVEKLIESLDGAPMERKLQLAERLREAGLVSEDNGAVDLHLSPEVLQKLGLEKGKPLELERMVQVLVAAIQILAELERTASSTVRDFRRQTALAARNIDLRLAASHYMSGSGDDADKLFRPTAALLGAMMAGMLGGGRDFSRQFSQRFSPEMIEQVVETEGKKGFMGPNKEERCWTKYKGLYRDIESAEAVDRWLKDCFARYMEIAARSGSPK